MHHPAHFREDSLPVLHELIRQAALAQLVTVGADGLEATPLPMRLHPDQGLYGMLSGHLARANPQWRVGSGASALAIFMGPHAYVSPAWYPSKAETGKAVPTWNYVTVHAHGPIEFFDDPDELRAEVAALTDLHEAGRPHPWALGDAPADFIDAMVKGIVGFRIPIVRLEGKRKLSQNRPEADRAGVIAALGQGTPEERAVAEAMAR